MVRRLRFFKGLLFVNAASPAEEEKDMRSRNWRLMSGVGAAAIALGMMPGALAQCGLPTKLVKPAGWQPQVGANHAFANSGLNDEDFGRKSVIVGMWHVKFIAETADPAVAPPGAVIDDALVAWHSDGTEIMNSMRPPQDGNFCMGVWEQVGTYKYKLNHFAWFAKQFPAGPGDQGTEIGPSVGPTQITETITLSRDGQHFSGTFTLTAYDLNNAIFQTFTGTVSGTRITIATKETDLL